MSKQFQTLRGLESDDVEEILSPINVDELLNYKFDSEFYPKADFMALKEQLELSKNQSILYQEKYKPTFELFGQMHYQGRDPEYNRADDEAWDKKNEWWVVGVRFMAPLFFLDAADTISAYSVQEESAQSNLRQKEMERLS